MKLQQEHEAMRQELEAMQKQKQEREKVYKQKTHSIYKKIEKYNAELVIKQENMPKEMTGYMMMKRNLKMKKLKMKRNLKMMKKKSQMMVKMKRNLLHLDN